MGGPVYKRREIGDELRAMRVAAGVTQSQAAEAIGRDQAIISTIERGRRPVNEEELRVLLDLYGAPSERRATVEADLQSLGTGQRSRGRIPIPAREPRLRRYVRLEEQAVKIGIYEEVLVPGLLQTEGYARAVIGCYGRAFGHGPEWVERQVQLRMSRQAVLSDPDPVVLDCVLGEAALRRVVGGPMVFSDQMAHLAEMASRRDITIRVLCFEAGEYPSLGLSFTLYWGPGQDEPGMSLIDNVTHPVYVEEPRQVRAHRVMFDHVQRAALTAEESRDLLEEVSRQ